jgi:hypothetical protein
MSEILRSGEFIDLDTLNILLALINKQFMEAAEGQDTLKERRPLTLDGVLSL